MREIEKDWHVRKLIQIYASYFAPIRGRAHREGRPYLLLAFKAALTHEGLTVESLDTTLTRIEGSGEFLLLAGKYIVDLVQVDSMDEKAVISCFARIPRHSYSDANQKVIMLNFGSQTPAWYPFEPADDEYYDVEYDEDEMELE